MSRYLMTNRAFNSWRTIITHLSLSAPDNSGCVNRRRRVRKGSLGTCKKTGKAYVRLYRARQQKTQTNIVGDVHIK